MTAYEMRISDWSSDVCSSELQPPCVARALHHVTPGKATDRYAAPRGVAVCDGRDIEVMARDMGDFAGAIEIADLRIGADEAPQLAALVIKFVRGGNERHDAHPGERQDRSGILPERDGIGAAHPPGGHEIEADRKQGDRKSTRLNSSH